MFEGLTSVLMVSGLGAAEALTEVHGVQGDLEIAKPVCDLSSSSVDGELATDSPTE